jgi:hypothetical protein
MGSRTTAPPPRRKWCLILAGAWLAAALFVLLREERRIDPHAAERRKVETAVAAIRKRIDEGAVSAPVFIQNQKYLPAPAEISDFATWAGAFVTFLDDRTAEVYFIDDDATVARVRERPETRIASLLVTAEEASFRHDHARNGQDLGLVEIEGREREEGLHGKIRDSLHGQYPRPGRPIDPLNGERARTAPAYVPNTRAAVTTSPGKARDSTGASPANTSRAPHRPSDRIRRSMLRPARSTSQISATPSAA